MPLSDGLHFIPRTHMAVEKKLPQAVLTVTCVCSKYTHIHTHTHAQMHTHEKEHTQHRGCWEGEGRAGGGREGRNVTKVNITRVQRYVGMKISFYAQPEHINLKDF